jgi:hypothetical protein
MPVEHQVMEEVAAATKGSRGKSVNLRRRPRTSGCSGGGGASGLVRRMEPGVRGGVGRRRGVMEGQKGSKGNEGDLGRRVELLGG